MKSAMRVFFISFLAFVGLTIFSCNNRNGGENSQSYSGNILFEGDPNANDPPSRTTNPSSEKTVKLTVKGIVCQSCKNSLETMVGALDGVLSVEVFLAREINNVIVVYQPQKIALQSIKKVIDETWEVVSIDEASP